MEICNEETMKHKMEAGMLYQPFEVQMNLVLHSLVLVILLLYTMS